MALSASSWGCELKYYNKLEGGVPIGQPLREAVSWNDTQGSLSDRPCSVSLFVRLWVEITKRRKSKKEVSRQPLREAVSWNGYDGWVYTKSISQPLREAVSWNKKWKWRLRSSAKSAFSWGCELKCGVSGAVIHQIVRQPLREAVSWNVFIIILVRPVTVSLFVRLWVEITVEKFSMSDIRCQPLREAVSWNIQGVFSGNWRQVSLFVRLWVEIRNTTTTM